MRGELSPAEEDMLEYLANLRDEQYQDDGGVKLIQNHFNSIMLML